MKKQMLFISLFACILLLPQGCAKNPVTGEKELSLMSKKQEIQIGKKHYPLMTQMNNGELKDDTLQQYVSKIGNQLSEVSHRPDLPYKFNIVNSSTPNAYALPGGFISVTRGLLLEMEKEKELAAVIGHEIAHATARHHAQGQTRNLITSVLLTVGEIYMKKEGVENAGLYSDIGQVGAGAILASYSREQEQQADRLGITYMAKAGYDPHGMIELQKTLLESREQEPNLFQQIFSTHPLSEKRIKDSRQKAQKAKDKYDIPTNEQLNKFDLRVKRTWYPRKPAYTAMDSGVQHIQNEEFQQAETDLREAINIYQDEAMFYAWLSQAQLEQGNPQPALDTINRAIKLNPDVFRIRFFSGVTRFELGEYTKSLDELKNAEDLLPDYPETDFYMGRNHEELGNRERAAEFYIEYLKRRKEGEHAQYAYQRLKQWGYIG